MALPVPEQYKMQSTVQLLIKADVITLQPFPLGEASQLPVPISLSYFRPPQSAFDIFK